jgi:hypothetical protein
MKQIEIVRGSLSFKFFNAVLTDFQYRNWSLCKLVTFTIFKLIWSIPIMLFIFSFVAGLGMFLISGLFFPFVYLYFHLDFSSLMTAAKLLSPSFGRDAVVLITFGFITDASFLLFAVMGWIQSRFFSNFKMPTWRLPFCVDIVVKEKEEVNS